MRRIMELWESQKSLWGSEEAGDILQLSIKGGSTVKKGLQAFLLTIPNIQKISLNSKLPTGI